MITQGAGSPKGGFVENARIIKDAVGALVPVSVAQRLNDPDFANEVVREGIDFITLSRAFHADPEYVQKLIEGRAEEIVPCIACQSCSELLAASRPARCTANPSTGLERRRRLPRPKHRRKALIVGGGLAGMQAARLLGVAGPLGRALRAVGITRRPGALLLATGAGLRRPRDVPSPPDREARYRRSTRRFRRSRGDRRREAGRRRGRNRCNRGPLVLSGPGHPEDVRPLQCARSRRGGLGGAGCRHRRRLREPGLSPCTSRAAAAVCTSWSRGGSSPTTGEGRPAWRCWKP